MKTAITEDEHRRVVNLLDLAAYHYRRLLWIQDSVNEIIGDFQNEHVEDVVWHGGEDVESLLGCLQIKVDAE